MPRLIVNHAALNMIAILATSCLVGSVQPIANSVQFIVSFGRFIPIFHSVGYVQFFSRLVRGNFSLGWFAAIFRSVGSR